MGRKLPGKEPSPLEQGSVFFLYRLRVHPADEKWQPRSLEDVARFYMVLCVKGHRLCRLIVLARKRLPDVNRREKEWGFVETVASRVGEIEDILRRQENKTTARGERVRPAARAAAEGVYVLVRHEDHTHLTYVLELPETRDSVQRELRIEPEANYIISVKNPEAPSPQIADLAPDEAARYPRALQERFEGRRFMPADPPELLNYPGAQVLLIGAAADMRDELGIQLKPEKEEARTAEIFRDLRLARSGSRVRPLFKGERK